MMPSLMNQPDASAKTGEETKNNSFHIEKMLFMNIHQDQWYVVCASESQDIEIVQYDKFRSVHRFAFKSNYGKPVSRATSISEMQQSIISEQKPNELMRSKVSQDILNASERFRMRCNTSQNHKRTKSSMETNRVIAKRVSDLQIQNPSRP